jgi:hypothetical protein
MNMLPTSDAEYGGKTLGEATKSYARCAAADRDHKALMDEIFARLKTAYGRTLAGRREEYSGLSVYSDTKKARELMQLLETRICCTKCWI